MENLPFAVVGATGQQGAAVVEALLGAGEPVRALVRDPGKAQDLADRGVEVVRADLEDREQLAEVLKGVRALSPMTTFAGADGVEGEIRRGTTGALAAADAAVPLVVYSSVGGAERHTGIPHFESKRRVEERLEELVPARFVRPTFFMDNLAGQVGEDVLRLPLPGDVPLQMVAVRDIGRAVAAVLRDPGVIGPAVEIAGDELTLDEAAATLGSTFEPLPITALGDDEDQAAMFRWFQEVPAYRADRAATRALVPDVLDLAGWLRSRR